MIATTRPATRNDIKIVMRLKPFIFLILIGSILSWVAFGFVLFTIDPFVADSAAFVFFYLSLAAAITGTASLKLLFIYSKLIKLDAPVYRVVSRSLRDGTVIAVLAITVLVLQSLKLLTIWNIGIFAVLILLMLSFYLTLNSSRA